MLSRYGNVKAGAYSQMNLDSDSGESTENINDIEKVLKKLGITMRDSKLEFRDFGDVLDELAVKWANLDSVSKNALATAFAGKRSLVLEHVVIHGLAVYKTSRRKLYRENSRGGQFRGKINLIINKGGMCAKF